MVVRTKKTKLSLLIKELTSIEVSFINHLKTLGEFFRRLRQENTQEAIVRKYDDLLNTSWRFFESHYCQFQSIDSMIYDPLKKLSQWFSLYSDETFFQSIFQFARLYRQFEKWGGEVECEKWMNKWNWKEKNCEEWGPVIFLQRLPQLHLLVTETEKELTDPEIVSLSSKIKEKIQIFHEEMRKFDLLEETSCLNQKEKLSNLIEYAKMQGRHAS